MFDFGLDKDQEARAKELHEKIITWDMLTESTVLDQNWTNMSSPGGMTGGSLTIGAGGIRHFEIGGSPDKLRFEDHSKFINLTRGLVGRGYSDEDIAKLMGGNWLRLMSETIG